MKCSTGRAKITEIMPRAKEIFIYFALPGLEVIKETIWLLIKIVDILNLKNYERVYTDTLKNDLTPRTYIDAISLWYY